MCTLFTVLTGCGARHGADSLAYLGKHDVAELPPRHLATLLCHVAYAQGDAQSMWNERMRIVTALEKALCAIYHRKVGSTLHSEMEKLGRRLAGGRVAPGWRPWVLTCTRGAVESLTSIRLIFFNSIFKV